MKIDFSETNKKIYEILQPLFQHMEKAYIEIASIHHDKGGSTIAFNIYERAKFRYLLEIKKERRRKRYYRMMERMRKK